MTVLGVQDDEVRDAVLGHQLCRVLDGLARRDGERFGGRHLERRRRVAVGSRDDDVDVGDDRNDTSGRRRWSPRPRARGAWP